jgi:predicted peroxiredoxin
MAKLVFISTWFTDNLERCTLPWAVATAAVAADNEVHLFLQGPAVNVIKKGATDGLQHEPFPALGELVELFVEAGGHLYACAPCLQSHKIEKSDMIDGVEIVGGMAMVEKSEGAQVFTY